jgi:hypothetical protein
MQNIDKSGKRLSTDFWHFILPSLADGKNAGSSPGSAATSPDCPNWNYAMIAS